MIYEASLEPPVDRRRKVYTCAMCEEPILEGDDYYEIGDFGMCCTNCIDDAKRYDAEPDYPEPNREEDF